MPLSVDIKINGNPITTLWIGRTEALVSKDSVHDYIVTEQYEEDDAIRDLSSRVIVEPRRYPIWDEGYSFKHKYSDGAIVCVRKALEALEAGDETSTLRG